MREIHTNFLHQPTSPQTLKTVKDFHLQAKDRIRPRQSHACNIRIGCLICAMFARQRMEQEEGALTILRGSARRPNQRGARGTGGGSITTTKSPPRAGTSV
jgi:hypothetical protein